MSRVKMPLSIGVNLRVTGHCNQGGRKYMEDMFCVAFQPTPDDKDLEYAFFGIFDGHGGGEAATFAKEHLMDIIVKQKNFWSDRDEDVLRAIRDGYVNTHYAMWRELGTNVINIYFRISEQCESRRSSRVRAIADGGTHQESRFLSKEPPQQRRRRLSREFLSSSRVFPPP